MIDEKELKNLTEEYTELNTKLSNPDSLHNQGDFQKISSRIAQLMPIIEGIKVYNTVKQELEEAKTIIENSSDKDMLELAQEELQLLEESLTEATDSLHELLAESDPNDVRNAIVEIRAGTGGEEAALFAGDLYRMYLRYAESHGLKMEQISTNKTGNGGYKEIIFILSGNGAYGKLKYENGVHRVQRVPSTESSGRIHTSAVSVVVLPEVDDIDIEVKDEDLKIDVYRSSGPGGQSVNTTDSAVRITHAPTGIVVTCQDEKSQHKNKARALSILKSKLYEIEEEKRQKELSDARQSSIKSGDRSAKIRTYNFPQSRVTDHRIKESWYDLAGILDGNLEEVLATTSKILSAQ
ncbi:peptide chain release factor 1 [Candidatus Dojkabacteria bacterium]|uniref:Peptide chain release factor 1 n=1 Tax=Candidatus Dojkabacteria bacterium TaxID=2099670 RepID=A0A955L8C3_9BACT|nr:peptide chain release factor 1 [Candidatus Dojkabacteria bacterium]